jgi:hypothetical protein
VGPDFAIFLNGSYGAGKSATLEHIGDQLAKLAQPFSLMDVDWFHRSWPPRADDLDNVVIEAENMAAVWANYLTAGPRQLVVSGVIATEEDRQRYEQALHLRVRPVRLVAGPAVTEARLRQRHRSGQHRALEWHLRRHRELTLRLHEADADEVVIDTGSLGPSDVAVRVLSHFGHQVT